MRMFYFRHCVVEGEEATELDYVNGMIERRIIDHCVIRSVIVVFVSVSDESNLAAPYVYCSFFVTTYTVRTVRYEGVDILRANE
jgi:hypothetical protein